MPHSSQLMKIGGRFEQFNATTAVNQRGSTFSNNLMGSAHKKYGTQNYVAVNRKDSAGYEVSNGA